MSSYKVQKKALHVPSLEEVSKVISKGLSKNFEHSSCEVVQCPDLTHSPWNLAAPGLSGSPRIGEAGGKWFLCPVPQKEKIYDFKELSKQVDLPEAFVIAAGAGNWKNIGKNCEIISNLTVGGKSSKNLSRIAKVGEDGECIVKKLPSEDTTCAVLINFYACEGKPGPVLRIKASKRTGKEDLIGCMRRSLEENYGDQYVGFGGTFRNKKGSVNIHVMPEFSKEPLCTQDAVAKWLKFYEMDEPGNFMSVAVSRDPDMDFRLEHSHGYGDTKGGHYHYDTTPDVVEYEGYFNIAEFIYRLDQPPKPNL